MRHTAVLAVLGCIAFAAEAGAQSSSPFNFTRPTPQEGVAIGNDALKALGVQPPTDPLKRVEPPRGAAGAQPSAAPAAAAPPRAPGECRARVTIGGWRWTEDGRQPVALTFTVESDEGARPRALAIDFAFSYRGGGPTGPGSTETAVKNYISTELLRLPAGDNPATRTIQTGPLLEGRTIMEQIAVGNVACRAE